MDYALENYFPTPRGYQRRAEEEENEKKKEEEGIATDMEVDQPYTQKDYALCKIYLAENVEDEEGLEGSEEEVEQQPSDVAFQQPNQPQAEVQGTPPLPFISDHELIEMVNDHDIPDDVDGLFPPYDDLFTREERARFLEEIARDAVKKRNTLLT